VVEDATGHFETYDAMACIAIDVRYRMPWRWVTCLIILGNTVTGIASATHNGRVGVVGVSAKKTVYGMTVNAFRVGFIMDLSRRLTNGNSTVVATAASPADIRMIKAAVRI